MQHGDDRSYSAGAVVKLRPGPRCKLEEDFAYSLHVIRHLAGIRCTQEEIATALDVSDTTLERFLKKHEQAREAYRAGVRTNTASLRRRQYEVAMAGNVQMLIFLGKNYLAQSDKYDVAANVNTTSHEDALDALS